MSIVPARLSYAGDTPCSSRYGDVYHSAAGGLAQARHVFLAGNDLPARWQGRESFVIAETGFGLGLNFLAAWQAWRDDPGRCPRLHFVSFEKHPLRREDLATVHRAWPELRALNEVLLAQWPLLVPGVHRLEFEHGRVTLILFFGDAAALAAELAARVDCFFLDGFDPAKNPDLWSAPLMKALTRNAAPDATLATWSVASPVREALSQAGWRLEKRPGFATKREMLVGRRTSGASAPDTAPSRARQAVVIGAGLAGTACAERLAARGWHVRVIEKARSPADGASGNPAGVLRPQPSSDDNHLARITRAGFLFMPRQLDRLARRGAHVSWRGCGALQLARDAAQEAMQRRIAGDYPEEYMSFVERDQASRLAGWPLAAGGWWYPEAGWVDPVSLCNAQLACHDDRIETLFAAKTERIEQTDAGWRALDRSGRTLAQAPVLILANAHDALRLAPGIELPLRVARGQINHLHTADPAWGDAPRVAVCRRGHVTPPIAGVRRFGASFVLDDFDTALRREETDENLVRLEAALPGFAAGVAPETLAGRAALRTMTPDRLPIVGALPTAQPRLAAAAGATRLEQFPRTPGLFALLGLGSRGLVWSALMAELLAARLAGEPLPLEARLVDALDPARFALRRMRRAE